MFTVIFDGDEGICVADNRAENYLTAFYHQYPDGTITVGSETLFTLARALVADGVIPCDKVRFMFNGEVIKHNRSGSLAHWPQGMSDLMMHTTRRLSKVRRADRENKNGALDA